MRNLIYTCIMLVILSSCEKEDNSNVDSKNLLVGFWEQYDVGNSGRDLIIEFTESGIFNKYLKVYASLESGDVVFIGKYANTQSTLYSLSNNDLIINTDRLKFHIDGSALFITDDKNNPDYRVPFVKSQKPNISDDWERDVNEFRFDYKKNEGYKEIREGDKVIYYEIIKDGAFPRINPSVNSIVGLTFREDAGYGNKSYSKRVWPTEYYNLQDNTLVEGLKMAILNMSPGDIWRVFVPWQLGYGDKGNENIPGYAILHYDMLSLEEIR